MDPFCYLCFVSVILSCLFSVALWPLAWKRTGILAFLYLVFSCDFVAFPCGVLGRVGYLIISIPNFLLLSYILLTHFLSGRVRDLRSRP